MENEEKLLTYPDPHLRRVSDFVSEVTPDVVARIESMFKIMVKGRGIGLAAPQIGWNVRIFVANVTGKESDNIVFINPEILERQGRVTDEEGCLSFPDVFVKVERPKSVVMAGLDIHGERQEMRAEGLTARCLLHEYDHLDGLLFIDRLSPVQQKRMKNRIRELADD